MLRETPGHSPRSGVLAAASRVAGSAPVIVLGYPHSGAARLLSVLSDSGLACTSGTGVLPLCHQAAAVWRRAEGRDADPGKISALAAASIHAMVGAVVTQILASGGQDRWCELALVPEDSAATFLSLYPSARFVCLHRSFGGVARAALEASPWGLAGPGYAPFLAAHPNSTLAALAAFWVAHTAALLAFEADHPAESLRVRYEDVASMSGTAQAIKSFLGLTETESRPVLHTEHVSSDAMPNEDSLSDEGIPVVQLPPALLAEVNDLLARLGYSGLSAS